MAIRLLSAATATGAGPAYNIQYMRVTQNNRTFQATGTTTSGAGAATVTVQVSNVPTPGANDWITIGTITLTLGTTSTTDGFVSIAAWENVRGNITAISGTGASVNLYMALG